MSTHDSGLPDMTNRADYWARRMADALDPVTEAERGEFHAWLFESMKGQFFPLLFDPAELSKKWTYRPTGPINRKR